jgi:hypothetical protein
VPQIEILNNPVLASLRDAARTPEDGDSILMSLFNQLLLPWQQAAVLLRYFSVLWSVSINRFDPKTDKSLL